jgi:hypothetical protein
MERLVKVNTVDDLIDCHLQCSSKMHLSYTFSSLSVHFRYNNQLYIWNSRGFESIVVACVERLLFKGREKDDADDMDWSEDEGLKKRKVGQYINVVMQLSMCGLVALYWTCSKDYCRSS